jgi:malate dehydrogenase
LITIIGSGKIGSSVATHMICKALDDILLLDIIENLPQGEALDLSHMASSYGVDVSIRGTNDYKDMQDSEIVIVTAGLARKPGMTRLELLNQNKKIVKEISLMILENASKSKILMVTNPLDIMTYLSLKVTGFKPSNVFGMGGMLDSSRFRYIISEALGVSKSAVYGLVIGEHGESMVPLAKYSTVSGNNLEDIITKEKINMIIEQTRKSAAQVIALKGATMHAPGIAVAEMVESIVKDKKKMMPLSTYLNGEYGINNICIGVPAILSKDGVLEIKQLELNESEKALFNKGAETIKNAISNMNLN